MTQGAIRLAADDYHADKLCPEASLSSTLAKAILSQSPLHAWTASSRLNPNYEPITKKTFDIGRAAHRAVLGAGENYTCIPDEMLDSAGKASSKVAKAFVADARSSGLTPLKSAEIAEIEAMRDKMSAWLPKMGIRLDVKRSEMSAFAYIENVWCRAMVDNAPTDPSLPLMDFKTCESANPDACKRAIRMYGYDVQAAHYCDTWEAATGEKRRFRFLFQEKSAPHEICSVTLGPQWLELGRRKIRRARQMWRICLDRNEWPGYPVGDHEIELDAWEYERWLERESIEADHKQRTGQDVLEAAMRFMAPENRG